MIKKITCTLALFTFFIGCFAVVIFTSAKSGEQYESQLIVEMENGKIFLLNFSDENSANVALWDYQKRSDVKHVEKNFSLQAQAFPNDTFFAEQWYLRLIHAKGGWSKELIESERRVLKEPVIAILDSGVDITHPDLKDKIWTNPNETLDSRDNDGNGYVDDIHGWDFILSESDPSPKFEPGFTKFGIHHGTLVSGIAAASSHNAEGVSGISWKSRILPLRVLDSSGNGTVFSVIQGIDYAVKKKADVINMSFVGTDFSQILHDRIQDASLKGVVVVAAAGNNQPDNVGIDMDNGSRSYPVCLDADSSSQFIVGVGSLDRNAQRSTFSNFGSDCIDISAPGEDIFGLNVVDDQQSGFDEYYSNSWSGTSLSAPMVSGAAAIIRSLRPDLLASEVIKILTGSVDDISLQNPNFKGKIGSGMINLEKVVSNTVHYGFFKEVEEKTKKHIVVGLGFQSFPQIRMYDSEIKVFKEFFAYAPDFSGSISVDLADFDGDGVSDIVASAGVGGGPHVRILTREGKLIRQFFAFDKNIRSGISVAVGDIDGDKNSEIAVALASGKGSEVKIFNRNGIFVRVFSAFESNYSGGMQLSIADTNNDGKSEIIVGAGSGNEPYIRIYDQFGNFLHQFLALDKNMKGGVNIDAKDINKDGFSEIFVSPIKKSAPLVRVFGGKGYFIQNEFYAYGQSFLGGVNIAVGDYDADGQNEIITGAGVGGGPHVRIFDISGNLKNQFFAHTKSYRGGVRVGITP